MFNMDTLEGDDNWDAPYRVLIVDDDSMYRAMEREILASPNYLTEEAASGTQALELLRRQEFDVVLIDKWMPGMNGDEVCRRIRTELNLAMLPIVMVTGETSGEHLALSLKAGATDFIRKPFEPLELLARLDAAARKKRLLDHLDWAESMLFSIARMVEAKDEVTGDHCQRLAHTGVVLGKALGLGREDLLALKRGGMLHDIGKLGIPDSILLKPGKLTEAEWAIMQQHPEIGADLVKDLKTMQSVVPIIRHHHERWDGSGYPDKLAGPAIPFLARVFQTVDIYDALANDRPYRPALSNEEIIAIFEVETAKGWRDPDITEVFLAILKNHPETLKLSDSPPVV
jgi:putative two-component system response regulator